LKEQKHIKIPQASLDTQSKSILIREFAGATSLNVRKKQIKAALIKEFASATSLNAPL
jgi:hypothetical protein